MFKWLTRNTFSRAILSTLRKHKYAVNFLAMTGGFLAGQKAYYPIANTIQQTAYRLADEATLALMPKLKVEDNAAQTKPVLETEPQGPPLAATNLATKKTTFTTMPEEYTKQMKTGDEFLVTSTNDNKPKQRVVVVDPETVKLGWDQQSWLNKKKGRWGLSSAVDDYHRYTNRAGHLRGTKSAYKYNMKKYLMAAHIPSFNEYLANTQSGWFSGLFGSDTPAKAREKALIAKKSILS